MSYVISSVATSQLFTGATSQATALSIWVDATIPDNEVAATSGSWLAACTRPGTGSHIGGAIGLYNDGSVGAPSWSLDVRREYSGVNKSTFTTSLSYTAGNRVQFLMADDGVAGTSFSTYMNGSSVATSGTTSTGTADGSANYYVGFPAGQFSGSDSSRKGTYFRVAFYSRKLTSTEASDLNSGAQLPQNIANLIYYQDFDRVTWVAPLRLRDLFPFFDNDTNIYNDLKTGVIGGPLNVKGYLNSPNKYFGLVEVIDENGTDDITLSAKFAASTLQGLVESYTAGGAPTWSAVTGSNDETVTTCLIKRTDAAGYYALCHYGNNSGTRKCMVYRCDDWVGTTWTVDQLPAISNGTGSDPDVNGVADVVAVQNEDGTIAVLPSGNNVLLYRGTKTSGSEISICRATKTNGAAWSTLSKTGLVIAHTVVSGGVCPGTAILDLQGRIHMYLSGADPAQGMWYVYSDNEGVTWSTAVQVLAPTAVATQADAYDLGDTPALITDIDTLFVMFGAENTIDYPGGTFRGRLAAVAPNIKDISKITRKAKWYYSGTRAYTEVVASGGALVSQTDFILLARFRGFRQTRSSQYREIYTEEAAFDKQAYLRLEGGGGGNAGKISFFIRNGSTFPNIFSTITYDDGEWHDVAIVRSSSGTPRIGMWIKIAGVWTEDSFTTTNPATTSTTPNYQAIGNWHASTPEAEPSEPFLGTIEALCVHGAPPSSTALPEALENLLRATPVVYSGGTLRWNSKVDGTDSGNVYLVESNPLENIYPGAMFFGMNF